MEQRFGRNKLFFSLFLPKAEGIIRLFRIIYNARRKPILFSLLLGQMQRLHDMRQASTSSTHQLPPRIARAGDKGQAPLTPFFVQTLYFLREKFAEYSYFYYICAI